MAQEILGLLSSKKFADEGDRFYSHRRKILHEYPNGSAPLTVILSMIDQEVVTDNRYYWYEKRYKSPKTLTRGTNPITSDAPSTGDADDGTNMTVGSKATTVAHYVKVDTTVDLRKGQIIQIEGGSSGTIIHLWIESVTRGVTAESSNGYVKAYPHRTYTAAAGDDHAVSTTGADATVRVLGTAFGEGARGGGVDQTKFKRPINLENTTQIFRTPMEFSGSVLKMGLKYDKTGPYKEKAKDTVVDHMTQIERSLLWGKRGTVMRSDLDGSGGETQAVRTYSGIIEFLELWDAGSVGLTIDGATYAPFSHKGQSTADSDDEKRIIANADGIVNVDRFNVWAERISRYHSRKTRDKLVLCGSQALLALEKMFRMNTTMMVKPGDSAYGLSFTTWITGFGTYHFMTHPLFNEDVSGMGKWMLFLDPNLFKLRALEDRDTKLLKNRQNPGDDFRKDEYLSELGLEAHLVEGNLLVKNISSYTEE
jgi:hypothetical protein